MKLKTFLTGLHDMEGLEDEVNDFLKHEGIDREDLVQVKTVSPDVGEISVLVLYEE